MPKKKGKRSKFIMVRVWPSEKELIRERAGDLGMSEYLRRLGMGVSAGAQPKTSPPPVAREGQRGPESHRDDEGPAGEGNVPREQRSRQKRLEARAKAQEALRRAG